MERSHSILQNHFIQHIIGFEHSPVTDLRRSQVSNVDLIVLSMFVLGPLTRREIRTLAQAFRGDPEKLDMYFQPHWGHVGLNAAGTKRLTTESGTAVKAPKRVLWYRCKEHLTPRQRVELYGLSSARRLPPQLCAYDLTVHGLVRAKSLVAGLR
jgi:hypothetical protein